MGILSTDEYLRRGHQINIDMMNLDSAINGVEKASPGTVPFADKQSWAAQKAEWEHYYDKNIVDIPILPIAESGDLDTWLTRIEGWKTRLGKYALLSGNAQARTVVSSLPDSPAIVEHRENPPSTKGVPPWLYLVLGTALLASLGYSVASVARLGGR